MNCLRIRLAIPMLVLINLNPGIEAQIAGTKMTLPRESLCVTEGAIEQGPKAALRVNDPKVRAYANRWTAQSIEMHFKYAGPTAQESRLGSGAIRRQFGLKLKAQDPCNLVYVMWRIEPKSEIVVSIKRNSGQTRSSECGNSGYQNIKPTQASSPPQLRPGDTHDFSAQLNGQALRVTLDGDAVWEGNIGREANDLRGPVGIRTDNVRLAFDLAAGAFVGIHPEFLLACKTGPDATE